MSASNLRQLLSLHEGRVAHVYPDSLGYLTIGVGHLVDKRKGGKLPEHIIDLLLDYDIEKHASELFAVRPWAKKLDEVRRAVMVDMAFNLGIEPFDGDGFKDWPKFVGAVERGEYALAAQHMRNSQPWASQVGQRAERLATMMESGKWPA